MAWQTILPARSDTADQALRCPPKRGHSTHLFKNRFGAVLQEDELQLLRTLRYVVRNPVESGLCACPDEWPWSGFRASVGLDQPPRFLDVERLLSFFGGEASSAMARYRELVLRPDEPDGV